MVKIDKTYVFEGPAGKVGLLELKDAASSFSITSCSDRARPKLGYRCTEHVPTTHVVLTKRAVKSA